MLDVNEKYCPVPWTSLYHHLNKNSPCHCVREIPVMSPLEFLESSVLQHIKKDLYNNTFPKECNVCERRESLGIKSTRKEGIRAFNEIHPEFTKLNPNVETKIKRLELRFSNLCNFKCRMCEPYSSSEIARDMITLEGSNFNNFEPIVESSKEQIEQLKNVCGDLEILCLTGGEPFLIKEYYDFLDFLIEKDLAKNITVELFTNCSTYNDKFISRLLKFKSVNFVVSIDGVDKTAEYIRYGTKWNVVKENILKFAKLPFQFYFNTAISQYTLLDVSSLAKFLMELYNINNNIKTKCYAVVIPKELHFLNMPGHHKEKVYKEIDEATEILKPQNFSIFVKEINDMKINLKNIITANHNEYVEFTEKFDKRRGQNFEEVFSISLK